VNRKIPGFILILQYFAAPLFAGPLEFIYPTTPMPWGIIGFLLGVWFLTLGVVFFLLRLVVGDKKAKLPVNTRQQFEKTYAEKLREDFKKKNLALDEKLLELRRHFSMIFMKIKNLTSTLDPDELFKATVEILYNELSANRFILFLYDPKKGELYPFRWMGYDDTIQHTLVISAKREHILPFALKKRQMIYRIAAMDDPETRGLVEREPITNTLLALPLYSPSEIEPYGVIHIESFSDDRIEFDETELKFYSSLSTFIGMALCNSNVFLQTRSELTSAKKVSERELSEKKKLKEVFSKYVSSELVDTLLENPNSVKLGGTTKQASILFSDISGFTEYSSKLQAEQVVATMNEYLSKMTEVVLQYNGEIDKFIGDAVMARFGVLVNLPCPGLAAVKAALGMLEELKELQALWTQQKREYFSIRIGIASGPVIAGNIGSEKRQEFTVMGNTVNLASRLEGLNKDLHTTILIDEATYQQVCNEVRAVSRDKIAIRGFEGQIRVYEVLGYHDTSQTRSKVISIREKMTVPKTITPLSKDKIPDIEIISLTPEDNLETKNKKKE